MSEPVKTKVEKKEKSDKSEKKEKKDKSVDKKEKVDKKDKKGKAATASPSTPSSPLPAADEDYEANRKAIEALCATPPNNMCADCCENGTRWASVNLGVFFCIRCSGIHRSLGVHISKVKSTNMDKWTRAEIRMMEAIGNRRAKELYESRVPKGTKLPTPSDSDVVVRTFIQKKYEMKAFAAEGVEDTLKRIQKTTGYRSSKSGGSGGAVSGSPASPSSKALDDMFGAKKDKKDKKKEKKVDGAFGTVTVSVEEHDAKRKKLLEHFGLTDNGATAAAVATAASEGGAAAANE